MISMRVFLALLAFGTGKVRTLVPVLYYMFGVASALTISFSSEIEGQLVPRTPDQSWMVQSERSEPGI